MVISNLRTHKDEELIGISSQEFDPLPLLFLCDLYIHGEERACAVRKPGQSFRCLMLYSVGHVVVATYYRKVGWDHRAEEKATM